MISPWLIIGLALAAGALAAIIAYFMAKSAPSGNGGSDYEEDMRQERAWKKHIKDMKKWSK